MNTLTNSATTKDWINAIRNMNMLIQITYNVGRTGVSSSAPNQPPVNFFFGSLIDKKQFEVQKTSDVN